MRKFCKDELTKLIRDKEKNKPDLTMIEVEDEDFSGYDFSGLTFLYLLFVM